MVSVRIYGKKGELLCKPFQVNTADDDPEVITSEEEPIFNFTIASDSDETESTEVATDAGSQGQ